MAFQEIADENPSLCNFRTFDSWLLSLLARKSDKFVAETMSTMSQIFVFLKYTVAELFQYIHSEKKEVVLKQRSFIVFRW